MLQWDPSRTIGQKATERATHCESVGRKAANLLPEIDGKKGNGWAAAEEAFKWNPARHASGAGLFYRSLLTNPR
jgi:hypothetical protein